MSRLTEARAAIAEARHERAIEPPSLFDDPTPYLTSVEANAGERWMEHAIEAIRTAARVYPHLTVDQVHAFLTEQPHDMRALGAAMKRAAREHIIEKCAGEYRISERPETHARPVAVWRSLVCEDNR